MESRCGGALAQEDPESGWSSMLGHYSAGFTLDTYTHVTNHMQLQAADKMGSFMDTALPETAPTPPEPPESGGCKVIPFEMVG